MNIGRKLTIALDWDNVLAPCTELACQKMTQRGTPVSVEDVTLYSFANFHKELADGLMAIFKEPDFRLSKWGSAASRSAHCFRASRSPM